MERNDSMPVVVRETDKCDECGELTCNHYEVRGGNKVNIEVYICRGCFDGIKLDFTFGASADADDEALQKEKGRMFNAILDAGQGLGGMSTTTFGLYESTIQLHLPKIAKMLGIVEEARTPVRAGAIK